MDLFAVQPGSQLGLGGYSANPAQLIIPDSNPLGYFGLYAAGVVGSAHDVMPLHKNGVQYQVTAAKTFVCKAILFWTGTGGAEFQLFTSTATFAQDDAVGALTAPVYQHGASARYGFRCVTANVSIGQGLLYTFAATTFPGIQVSTASNSYGVMIIGNEI